MTKGIVTCNLYKRKGFPSVNAEKLGYFVSGDEVEITDALLGETENDYYEGTPSWYKISNGTFIWSGGVSLNLEDSIFKKKIGIDKKIFEKEKTTSNFQEDVEIIPRSIELFQNEVDLRFKRNSINYNKLFEINENLNKGDKVAVAIFDDGIQKSHSFFQDKFGNQDFKKNLIGDHGTRIAGLIGAPISTIFTGISPNAMIIDCNMFNEGGIDEALFVSHIDNLLQLIKSENIKGIVANISYSFPSDQDFIKKQLDRISREIIIVASAGEATRERNELLNELQFPSSMKNVISVGTVNLDFLNLNDLFFNDNLNYLLPDFYYWSCTTNSNEAFSKINEDSAATAVISGLIANLISTDKLRRFPSFESVILELDKFAHKIKNNSNLLKFQIYKP